MTEEQIKEEENLKKVSDKQINHLKYAREVKKSKKEYQDKLGQSINDNLEFIFNRLKQIDGKLNSIAIDEPPLKKQKIHQVVAEKNPDNFTSNLFKYGYIALAGVYIAARILPRIQELYVGSRESSSIDGDKINPYSY